MPELKKNIVQSIKLTRNTWLFLIVHPSAISSTGLEQPCAWLPTWRKCNLSAVTFLRVRIRQVAFSPRCSCIRWPCCWLTGCRWPSHLAITIKSLSNTFNFSFQQETSTYTHTNTPVYLAALSAQAIYVISEHMNAWECVFMHLHLSVFKWFRWLFVSLLALNFSPGLYIEHLSSVPLFNKVVIAVHYGSFSLCLCVCACVVALCPLDGLVSGLMPGWVLHHRVIPTSSIFHWVTGPCFPRSGHTGLLFCN